MSYSDIEKRASEKGYWKVRCRTCRGTGESARPDANSPKGRKVESPCPSCKGTGRLWSNGTVNKLNDEELMALR